jgi:hypothetical protein
MDTTESDDWRIAGQEKYLLGAVLELRTYSPPRPNWDHDHCEFCWSMFCQSGEPGCLHEGYVTGDGKHWICRDCFHDFRDRFHLSVRES